MKRILFFIMFFTVAISTRAQVTLDECRHAAQENYPLVRQYNLIHNTGNGFFVSEDGLALSDYTLFKGAERECHFFQPFLNMCLDYRISRNRRSRLSHSCKASGTYHRSHRQISNIIHDINLL